MPDKKAWTADDIPDLSGKTIVVTGGNSGIGYEAALAFARKRAEVVLACRDLGKARTAAAQIAASATGAKVDVMELDLSNLASVRGFSDAFHLKHQALDVLCNNAGVMAIPYRQTADGFEMQFGTNHLGHFALTGLLLDRLIATEGARVVNVASGAHRMGKIRFDDLQWKNGYRKWMAYGQSKLANLLFTTELQRKVDAAGKKLLCRRMPSRIRGDQPAVRGTENVRVVDARIVILGWQQSVRAKRRDGCVADRVCGRRTRRPRWRLHRPRRDGRVVGESRARRA